MLKADSPFSKILANVAGALAALCVLAGCNTPPGTPAAGTTVSSITAGTSQAPPPSNSQFQPSEHEPFDGQRAMEILKKQCEFGVRPLGSEAHEKTKDYLIAQMKQYADEVKLQPFKYRSMPVTNIIGVFYPAGSHKPAKQPVLLMTHWDTRPIADGPFSSQTKAGVVFRYGANGWTPTAPIMGANDAASGVAVLLELARIFKQKPPPVGVIMLLDDGEDYGDFQAYNNQEEGVELGARYFSKTYRADSTYGQPVYGILLDMVGAKNAIFVPEDLSQRSAPNVNDRVFLLADKFGYGNIFQKDLKQSVGDDHVSINEAGIPTIDIIHPLPFGEFDSTGYTYWHTQQDTADKCSAATLKAVGDTVAEAIYREAPGH